MKGYQISILTEQDRTVGKERATDWLMHLAKQLGISGCTVFSGAEGFGSDGRRHSARFFELADQPVEILMAVTEEQADRLFDRLRTADTRLFYIKTPIDFGEIGTQAAPL